MSQDIQTVTRKIAAQIAVEYNVNVDEVLQMIELEQTRQQGRSDGDWHTLELCQIWLKEPLPLTLENLVRYVKQRLYFSALAQRKIDGSISETL